MTTPHKHAAAIHAWADGAVIEFRRFHRCGPQHLTPWEAVRSPPNWGIDDDVGEFRIQPHRWQREIDAQKAGKVVQFQIAGGGIWRDAASDADIKLLADLHEFRIKPEVVQFRVALMKSIHLFALPIVFTRTVNNEKDAERCMGRSDFVEWIGDWQEVEVAT